MLFFTAFLVWFRNVWVLRKKPLHKEFYEKQQKVQSAVLEVSGAISSVKLNKVCSREGLTFHSCISLNHCITLENTEKL